MIARQVVSARLWIGIIAAMMITGCATTDRSPEAASEPVEHYQAKPARSTPPPAEPARTANKTTTFSSTTRTSGNMIYVSMAYPTGDPQTSAIGIEKAVPREVRVNNPFTYTLKATNLTNQTLRDVVVSEKIGENLKITASSPRGQATKDGNVNWPLGSLGPNESKTVNVTAAIAKAGAGSSCAAVSYSSSLCTSITAVEPKLLIALAGPSQVMACDDINYTLRVTNTGTGTVQNVRVSQPLPDGITTKDGQRAVEMSIPSLTADETKQFTISAKASKPGKYAYTATAASADGLTAKSNPVTTVVRKPVLTITKQGPKKAFLGRNVSYDVVVTNTGDGEARNTVVEDVLTSDAKLIGASAGAQQSGNVVQWSLGSLAPKASKKVSITLKGDQPGLIRNTARARAFCAADVTASAETLFEGIPAILLEVIDLEDPIEVGQNVVYNITATNQGTANGTNVQIDCTLEEYLEYVTSTGSTKSTVKDRVVSFAAVPVLAPGQKVSWQLTVKAVKAGDARFQVSLNSDQLSRPVNEDEATNLY